MYLFLISLASDRTRFLSDLRSLSIASWFPHSTASLYLAKSSFGNLESIGRKTSPVPFPGSLMANSTKPFESEDLGL